MNGSILSALSPSSTMPYLATSPNNLRHSAEIPFGHDFSNALICRRLAFSSASGTSSRSITWKSSTAFTRSDCAAQSSGMNTLVATMPSTNARSESVSFLYALRHWSVSLLISASQRMMMKASGIWIISRNSASLRPNALKKNVRPRPIFPLSNFH